MKTLTKTFTVQPEHTAQVLGSGDMPVLATPMLVAYMENTAMLLAAESLTEGQTTVGTQISSDHRHPTPVRAEVTVTATLAEQDGRRYVFHIEASDEAGIVAACTHERFAVARTRFLEKVGIHE